MNNTITYTQTAPTQSLDRTDFLRKTYFHLLGAVAAFVGLEIILFKTGLAYLIGYTLASNWLITLGGFVLLGWIANYFAQKSESLPQQYVGLGLYVFAQALIFTPLLLMAVVFSDPSVLTNAIYATLATFGVLTAIVGYSGKDFSFMGPFLAVTGLVAMAAIVGSLLFSVTLGFYFSLAMVVFAAGTVLYETSKVVHNYRDDQYVSASLGLFASVALLFYYILMIFTNRN